MEVLRTFIAVSLTPEVKQELARVIGEMTDQIPEGSVRWVKPDLMHITLRFLGETAVSKMDAIYRVMDDTTRKQTSLRLQLHGTGCFPNARRPRVVWAGLVGDITELAALKRELDKGLEPLGWEIEERPFKPHLTLGRIKDGKKQREISWSIEVEERDIPVTAVHLIESQLTRNGPIYTIRHTSQFS